MVLLDYPDPRNPNRVYLKNEKDEIIFASAYQEDGLESTNFIDAYLAYSPAGEAKGDLVYVNYGSKADFDLLSNESSLYYTNVTGKICMSRYGDVFRGNKV